MRALLVLDMFEDLVGTSAGSAYSAQVQDRQTADRVREAVAGARARGDLVVWVTLGFEPAYVDLPLASPLFGQAASSGAFLRSTTGTQPLAGLGWQDSDPTIVKSRVSPFFGTRLETLLRTAGVTQLLLAGVATDHVVLAAARDAHDRDFAVTILTDAVASSSAELHEAALLVSASFTDQLTVRSVPEFPGLP